MDAERKIDPSQVGVPLIASHMIRAQVVRNRLNSHELLSAQEIIDGVKLGHEEYLQLVALATAGLRSTK